VIANASSAGFHRTAHRARLFGRRIEPTFGAVARAESLI
jgi:hypothetical protein